MKTAVATGLQIEPSTEQLLFPVSAPLFLLAAF